MKRKDLIISVLIILCLAVAVFPNSTTSQIQAEDEREYDPWLDTNDDGKIRIDDLLSVVLAYGNDGDPTKNVTVTNFPLGENESLMVKTPTYTSTMVLCEDLYIDLTESPELICSTYVDSWKKGTVFIKITNGDRIAEHELHFMANDISFRHASVPPTVCSGYIHSDETGGSFEILGPAQKSIHG